MPSPQSEEHASAIKTAFSDNSRPDAPDFQYGTAGFRMNEALLDYPMFTVGIVATLRSRKLQGQAIGVMITASHNPAADNGVKLVDPQGEMLEQDWEKYAKDMANCRTADDLYAQYQKMLSNLRIDEEKPATVIFARDTRPSGDRLVEKLVAGLAAAGLAASGPIAHKNFGILTTPQLHYLVKATNTQNTPQPYGKVSEQGYYEKLATAFKTAMDGIRPKGVLTVDCANGVGAPKLKELMKHIPSADKGGIDIRVVGDEIDDPKALNYRCGADFVKTQQRVPDNFDGKPYDRWASYDGDADRIVYYFNEEGSIFRLLDGDRIATLAAKFIGDLVNKSGLSEKITIAVVQTAYANGSSTKYIENSLRLKVHCTPTGVKHLHHAAAHSDIGVYFEANGHGTVLFSPKTLKHIHKHQPESPAQRDALETLRAVTDLINQTVGDAISDMLLVEVILAHTEFTVKEWLATYKDLPNKLAKVEVSDRSLFTTVPGTAEQKLESPKGVQEQIDGTVKKYKEGRCFVRASGTENAVRIYGEAAEMMECEELVRAVVELIRRK